MSDLHHGGCLCGNVRYQTIGAPLRSGVCHCRYCQLRAGSAFGVLVYFPEDRFQLTAGACKEYTFTSESGKAWQNSFCADCGTTVFSQLEVWPGDIGVAGGTFDPPSFWYNISGEVFTRSKAHFVGEIDTKYHVETFHTYDPQSADADRLSGADAVAGT